MWLCIQQVFASSAQGITHSVSFCLLQLLKSLSCVWWMNSSNNNRLRLLTWLRVKRSFWTGFNFSRVAGAPSCAVSQIQERIFPMWLCVSDQCLCMHTLSSSDYLRFSGFRIRDFGFFLWCEAVYGGGGGPGPLSQLQTHSMCLKRESGSRPKQSKRRVTASFKLSFQLYSFW